MDEKGVVSYQNLTLQKQVERKSVQTDLHDWYRFVFGYELELVESLIGEMGIESSDLLYDPFVGTGTTVVTAKSHGINAIGTDTSPVAVLSSRAKTNWSVDLGEYRKRKEQLLETVKPVFRAITNQNRVTLETFQEGKDSQAEVDLSNYEFSIPEKMPTGWLSERPRKKMQVLKQQIEGIPDDSVTQLFKLAMISVLTEDVANLRYGPEATRVEPDRDDVDVLSSIRKKLCEIEETIERVQSTNGQADSGNVEVFQGDAREAESLLQRNSEMVGRDGNVVDYIITSPPYPAEHDYTRNQRLELIWLDEVTDTESLQSLKKQNIRSHSKNIYADDEAGQRLEIRKNGRVDRIVTEMEDIIEEREVEHGFGQSYPRVIEEYFAGMLQHLQAVNRVLSSNGEAAYVVADSGSYWQVEVETATILAELAENRTEFAEATIKPWREITATTAAYDSISEHVLILR